MTIEYHIYMYFKQIFRYSYLLTAQETFHNAAAFYVERRKLILSAPGIAATEILWVSHSHNGKAYINDHKCIHTANVIVLSILTLFFNICQYYTIIYR